MRLRFARGQLALTLMGVLVPGCLRPQLHDSKTTPAAPPPEVRTETRADLPPAQAADVCLAVAHTLEQNGRESEAIMQYERARHYNPRLAQVSRRLAVLYDRQQAWEQAQVEYDRALQASPRDAGLLNDVGYFHYRRGQWPEAESRFRQALEVDPNHQRAWVNLGLTLAQQERGPESVEAFGRVVKPGMAHANLGIILLKKGKRAEARQALQQALALEPDLRQAQVALGVLEKASAAPEAAANHGAE